MTREFENLCCIYPCAPFVNSNLLIRAYNQLIEKNFDTVLPIIPFSSPIQRALRVNQDKVSMIHEDNLNVRSQDLEKSFHDAGQFYWCNTKKVLSIEKLITSNSGGIEISELDAQDIDNEMDWRLAELKYQLK